LSESQEYNFLFVSAPFSGIEVFMKNMNYVNDKDYHIKSSWIWLDRTLNISGFRGTMLDFVNWTVKASYFTSLRIRELERSGIVFDAAFFNHITPITFLLKFRRRIPTVLSLDSTPMLMDQYSDLYRSNTKSKLPGWILRHRFRFTRKAYYDASLILAWSEVVKESLVNDYSIPGERIVVVPPGVDTARFGLVNRSGRPGAQRKLKILFVGGDFIRKGGDVLVELAHQERFKDFEFHFVTRSFEGEQGPNIFVYDSISPESDLLEVLYKEADIFVLPTRADFCPTNTICEAMAMGLPVISTTVGGLGEIVKDRETGLVMRLNDAEHLASLIEELAADGDMRLRIGAQARECVEERYDLQKNSREIFSHLARIADGRKRSAASGTHSGKTLLHG